jgi:hypothetical protein
VLEATHQFGLAAAFGRLEAVQVETDLLRLGTVPGHGGLTQDDDDHAGDEPRDTVLALTLGGVRDLWHHRGFELGLGADIMLYRVPQALRPTHGSRPVSFHVFLRLRPPAPMGRMWNMTMTEPMRH